MNMSLGFFLKRQRRHNAKFKNIKAMLLQRECHFSLLFYNIHCCLVVADDDDDGWLTHACVK